MILSLLVALACGASAAGPEVGLPEVFQALGVSIGAPTAPEAAPFVGQTTELAPSEEAERKNCPRSYETLEGQPDPDLYSYIGFVWVRSDESTCAPAPSDRVLYLDPQGKTVSLASENDQQPSQAAYELDAPEYKVRRNFYFRTQLDGSRRFYAAELRVWTGRRIGETIVLEFPNRDRFPLLPWEQAETFALRYGQPSGGAASAVDTSYEYRDSTRVETGGQGRLLTRIRFEALRKKALTPADPDAVRLGVGESDGLLTLAIEDRWARYYAAERLGLRMRLWQAVPLFPDRVAYEFDVELDPEARIFIHPQQDSWTPYRRHAIERGHEYYVDWSFRRSASRISSGDWVKKERSNRFRF